MLVEVKVPQLSESVAEATLVSWHKKAGEYVKRDENLVDIETDKVVLETPRRYTKIFYQGVVDRFVYIFFPCGNLRQVLHCPGNAGETAIE